SDDVANPTIEVRLGGGSSFVGDAAGRLGFVGPCSPAARSDLHRAGADGRRRAAESKADDDDQSAKVARFCVRVRRDDWVERRLNPDDATHLSRWVPGDDGQVTALVLGDGPVPKGRAAPRGASADGVRVVRINAAEPALAGARFPAVLTKMSEPPYRSIDTE